MDDAGTGEMDARKALHSFPRPTTVTSLTAAPKRPTPETSDCGRETVDAVAVARHGMIIEPALQNAPQPATRFAHWPMHSLA